MRPAIIFIFLFGSNLLIGEDISFFVDLETSKLRWTGEKVIGTHWGYVKLKEGVVSLKDNELSSGRFIVDMSSISVEDIKDWRWSEKLEDHLKSSDFFDVENYPEATLSINSVKKSKKKIMVTCELFIKGITQTVEFPVQLNINKTNATAQGRLTIDRTLYDIKYRSGKYFGDLGNKLIYDNFHINFELQTK